VVAQPNVDVESLPAAVRKVVENAAGSARLEGVTIADEHRRLAAAFLAGDIDEATYRAKAVALTVDDVGLDA
jgi:Antitoxin VbhA